MPGALDPFDGDACVFVPFLIISNTGTGMILFAANQQCRAFYFIGQIFFHCLGKDSEAMSRYLGITFLVTVICHHDSAHQFPAVYRYGDAVGAGF